MVPVLVWFGLQAPILFQKKPLSHSGHVIRHVGPGTLQLTTIIVNENLLNFDHKKSRTESGVEVDAMRLKWFIWFIIHMERKMVLLSTIV